VVDDYDVVSATSPDTLGSLLALLPHAADIGLHLIVARRCAGSARAMFDPLLAHLRDSGCAGLLMSGSPEEGGLIGHHRAVVQPPGRGMLVTRSAAQLVQVGWCPP
jgi:S-DNA-T family DNA segregation ATPase FtsK/SpoIIIE